MSDLARRFRERKLFQWTIAYVAGAWAIMQVVDVVSGRWPVGLGVQRAVDIALATGFLATLVLAWYHGEQGRQRVSGAELLIIGTLMAIGGLLVGTLAPTELGPGTPGVSPTTAQASIIPLRAVLRDNPSVAILPLDNLGSEEDLSFVDGLHDEILTALQRIGGLTVISRTSVLVYRDARPSMREIARTLQVDAIGEGSVSRAGNRIRVNVQLIDGADEGHLWAETYDRELTSENVFDIRSDVAQAVAVALRATLTPAEARRLATRPTTSMTAYDWLQAARFSGGGVELLRRALETDSLYADGWSYLGRRYALQVANQGAPRTLLDSAVLFADRALEVNPDNWEAYHVKGLVAQLIPEDIRASGALPFYMKAIERNPGSGGTWNNIGLLHWRAGQYAEAVDALRRSVRLAPTNGTARGNLGRYYAELGMNARADEVLAPVAGESVSGLVSMAYVLALRGDLERARELGERAVELNASHPQAHQMAAGVAVLAGDLQRARVHAEVAYALRPDQPWIDGWPSVRALLAYALLQDGQRDRAQAVLGELETRARVSRSGGAVTIDLAAAAALRGDRDEAGRLVAQALQEGYRDCMLEISPLFSSLRGAPEFDESLARMRADLDAGRRQVERMEAELGPS